MIARPDVTRRRPWRLGTVALLIARVALAQQPSTPARGGTISGSVIDATTGVPLAGSTVTLSAANGFGVISGARTGPSSFALARTLTTSASGTYGFADLPAGAYNVFVQRLGYAPTTILVELGESGMSPLSIGLVVAPVRLRAIEVRAEGASTFGRDRPDKPRDENRVIAARERSRSFLSTDTRELTAADVAESATLGGGDVLRALQRLPGVTQFDDWSAKLWVRGSPWDHNRLYYDGLPLFEPLQALGRGSGVSADAIGAAFLFPGVRPVSLGGEGATQIDLRSRPAIGSGAGAWRGAAELSLFGLSGALERERENESAGFSLSAHHTLGEWLPHSALLYEPGGDRWYSDEQVAARGDIDLGNGRRIETSGLLTRDSRRYRTPIAGDQSEQDWGNVAGRATFLAPLGSFATSHTVGISRFSTNSARWFAQVPSKASATSSTVSMSPVTSTIDYVTIGGRIEPLVPSRNRLLAGYDLTIQRSSIGGPRQSLYWGDLSMERIRRNDALGYASVWGDWRASIGERLTIEGGLRLDHGGSAELDAVRSAPSAQARVVLSPNTWLSIGASRTHQYVQSVELPIAAQGQTVPALWLTSGRDVPVMFADNAMAGVEHWMGSAVIAANAYARRTTGGISADPLPGALIDRPLFVDANESAHGVELSARKLTGRSTGFIAYSYGRATTAAGGLSFPSSADRTHAFDAGWMVRLGGVRLNSVYTATSGAPYTRNVSGRVFDRGAPNAQRLPAYASLDLSLDYTRSIGHAALVGFAGMQNVLGRTNLTWYETTERGHDLFQAPVRFAPTLGLRLVY